MLEMTEVHPATEPADVEAPGAPGTSTPTPDEGLAGEFAVGAGVPRTWDDPHEGCPDDCCEADGPCVQVGRRGMAQCCKGLGARRLGYMAVLRWKDVRGTPAPMPGGARRRTKLLCVVGPFWPFTACVTYPLIFLVSGAIGITTLPERHVMTQVVWAASVLSLVTALSCVAFRDPGVLRRHPEKPEPDWRWNDQARTFRPPGAAYDEDLGLVVAGFDHVCPWTGTGIGHGNMGAFHAFVSLLCVCIVVDVLIVIQVLP